MIAEHVTSGGRVLPFNAAATRVRKRPLDSQASRGTILLFTGVRYERMVAPTAGVSASDQAGTERRLDN